MVDRIAMYNEAVITRRGASMCMRNLRKAVFEARLETGGGTIEDLTSMHTWTGILLKKAYDMAENFPGTECQEVI